MTDREAWCVHGVTESRGHNWATELNPNYSLKVPYLSIIILGVRSSMYQSVGTHSVHNTLFPYLLFIFPWYLSSPYWTCLLFTEHISALWTLILLVFSVWKYIPNIFPFSTSYSPFNIWLISVNNSLNLLLNIITLSFS